MYNTIVWIAEGFLAVFFLAAGLPKIVGRGIDRWVGFDQLPRAMTILIGCCEIAAAVGLLVPILAGYATWTTPLAGLGISVLSLMASGFHLRNREGLAALETALWALLAGSIAAARWGEFTTGPAISKPGLLGPLLLGLVVALISNLVVLTRSPHRPTGPRDRQAHRSPPSVLDDRRR